MNKKQILKDCKEYQNTALVLRGKKEHSTEESTQMTSWKWENNIQIKSISAVIIHAELKIKSMYSYAKLKVIEMKDGGCSRTWWDVSTLLRLWNGVKNSGQERMQTGKVEDIGEGHVYRTSTEWHTGKESVGGGQRYEEEVIARHHKSIECASNGDDLCKQMRREFKVTQVNRIEPRVPSLPVLLQVKEKEAQVNKKKKKDLRKVMVPLGKLYCVKDAQSKIDTKGNLIAEFHLDLNILNMPQPSLDPARV